MVRATGVPRENPVLGPPRAGRLAGGTARSTLDEKHESSENYPAGAEQVGVKPLEEHREDLRLVGRVMQKDPDAIATFVARMKCVPRMLTSLNAKLGRPLDEHELADLSQEVLVVVWRRLAKFRGRSAFEAWVYRVCFNLMMNTLRKNRRRAETRSLAVAAGEAEEIEVPVRDPHEFEDVYAGLDRIPEPEAAVIRLKHFGGLTFDEVGGELGISANTAKTRYYRGITGLQAQLREDAGAQATASDGGGH